MQSLSKVLLPVDFSERSAGSGAIRENPRGPFPLRNHAAALHHAVALRIRRAGRRRRHVERDLQRSGATNGDRAESFPRRRTRRLPGQASHPRRRSRAENRRIRSRGEREPDRHADARLRHFPPLHPGIEHGQSAARRRMSGLDRRPYPGCPAARARSRSAPSSAPSIWGRRPAKP